MPHPMSSCRFSRKWLRQSRVAGRGESWLALGGTASVAEGEDGPPPAGIGIPGTSGLSHESVLSPDSGQTPGQGLPTQGNASVDPDMVVPPGALGPKEKSKPTVQQGRTGQWSV